MAATSPARKPLVVNGSIDSSSYSRISAWEKCGYFAGLKFVARVPEGEESTAMKRGSAIGKLAEQYVLGQIPRLPRELANFEEGFRRLKAYRKKHPDRVGAEETWAFKADWSPTVYNDWKGCKWRIKTDVWTVTPEDGRTIVEVIDHKTGKYDPRWGLPGYLDQLSLYEMGGLIKFQALPNLTVRSKLWFLDHGIEHPSEGDRTLKDLPGLLKSWEARAKRMTSDRRFDPKPQSFCQWCPYRSSNDGPGPCSY